MSWSTAVAKPPIFAGEDERALKLEYARLLVELSGQASEAAYALFPGEQQYGRAWAVAEHWPHDPTVAAEVARLLEPVEVADFLKDREQAMKLAWDRAHNETDAKLRFAYFQEYNKLAGFIAQPGQQVNVNVVQNVIEVPTRASEDELPILEGQWAEQQRKLIADARSSRPN